MDNEQSNSSLQIEGAKARPPLPHDAAPAAHIVVVEDDAPLRTLLSRFLREEGYMVTGAGDGGELMPLLRENGAAPVDLILLDITLPGEDGLTLCRKVRAKAWTPVIMVSARGQETDRVAGLDCGADDYIAKPFSRAELMARIRALLRRSSAGEAHSNVLRAPMRFRFSDWSFDARLRKLLSPDGAEVILTAAEEELLYALLRHPHRTIGRERLLEMTRQRISGSADRSIDVLMSRLRGKLGGRKGSGQLIRTVRGVGYMLAAEVTAS